MKKIALILLLCLSLQMLFSVDYYQFPPERIPVEFVTEGENRYGFSTETVISLKEVDSSKKLDNDANSAYEMRQNIPKGVYTTDPFHFYAQLLDPTPIKVDISCTALSDGNNYIDYDNVGNKTATIFSGTTDGTTNTFTLFAEDIPDGGTYTKPRVYSYDFEFQVPFESVSGKAGDYYGSVTVSISPAGDAS